MRRVGHALIGLFLTFRFVLELAMFAALWVWAVSLPIAPYLQLPTAIAVVAAAAVVWGVFVSPKARVRLPENARLSIELSIVLAAVLAVRALHRPQLALALAVAAVAVAIVNSVLRRSGRATSPARWT